MPVRAARHATGFGPAEIGRVDRLLRMVQARLEAAPGVARMRWETMSRIEDGPGEARVIEAARTSAGRLRLDPGLAAEFARAQIDAGKIIQTARHQDWAANRDRAPARNVKGDGFQAATPEPEFGAALLRALRDAAPVLRRPGGRALLDARAADLIHVGGQDLLAGQTALGPLYEIAR